MFGKWTHTHYWKRRERTAPSAPHSDKEIVLAVVWNGEDIPPPRAHEKDPILWGLWMMKSDWTYVVATRYHETSHRWKEWENASFFKNKKDALKEYRRRVKDFPRSKEVENATF
jgi:hypothetical protein